MTTRAHIPISFNKILSYYCKSCYQTKRLLSNSNLRNNSETVLGKHLSKCFKKPKNYCDNIIVSENKMPIVTAVAAHRQSHHTPRSMHHRFSLMELGSSGRRILESVNYSKSISFAYHSAAEIYNDGNLFRASKTQSSLPYYNKDIRRYYAKGKDKPKTNKKSIVTVNEAEMAEVIDVQSLKSQLEKALEQMKDEFSKQLSIRGTSGALETLSVEFEGETYPLQELAQVGRKNPQLAVLNLSSLPEACQPVLKAIQDSGMNLNPQQEGTTIYVPLPKVTREHRENLSKNAKVLFNKCKTSLQNVQNKFTKQCKSQKDVSEDLSFNVQQQIMKITETYIADAEKLLQAKQNELLDK